MQFDRLLALLESGHARFRVIEHAAEGRSDLVAAIRGTAPRQGAKAMLCRSKDAEPRHALVVLPGDRKLDFGKVAQAIGARKATLASPEEAMALTGCVIGAIPPFVENPALRLVVDPALVQDFDEIAFNAGRLDRSMVLDAADYVRIARPLLHAVCA